VDDRCSNIMTVDVEDWFHILEFDGGCTRDDWDGLESRVERNSERLLELFAEVGVRASFFVVGWVAERQPGLIRRIAAAGHELASHSYWHEVVRFHSRESLAADLERSKKLVEDLTGLPVRGFKAPGGSITPQTAWAFDVIVEQGYAYDASLCPVFSSHGGFPSPHLGPHRLRCASGELFEVPKSTLGAGGRRVPYAGGGYLRLLPYALIRSAVHLDNRSGRPATVYIHPREIDPQQPRMELPPKRRFKYYVGLRSAERKLGRLLRDFRFVPAADWIAEHEAELAERVLDVREAAAAAPPSPDPARVPPPPPGTGVRSA
jgi:polysaccharide deacetylase family protein (PEP-CTERM system associated)